MALRVTGRVVRGHGVASGRAGDHRHPAGTIRAQTPHFAARGVDLAAYHPGTLNVSLGGRLDLLRPDRTLRAVRWHPDVPAEDFSFLACRLEVATTSGARAVDALLYLPHPDTKPDHHQPDDVVEVLAPWIDGVADGASVTLELPADRVRWQPA